MLRLSTSVLLVELLVFWLSGFNASVNRNIILFSVDSDTSAEHTSSYGWLKSSMLTYLSWDNKLRYCNQHNASCLFWVSDEQHDHNVSPRMKKVRQLLRAVKQARVTPNSVIAYLDVDIVITQPLINWCDDDDHGVPDLLAFYRSKASLAMTEDYNHTTAMRPSLGSANRYQTGVIFLKATKETQLLLKEWLKMTTSAQPKPNRFNFSAIHIVSDWSNQHSDQWMLNELLNRTPILKSQVYTLSPRHVYNAFPVYKDAPIAQLWDDLKLPYGDELQGVSQIVHFAGVFGGASIETGRTDPTVQLLAACGYLERHLHSIRQLANLHRNHSAVHNDIRNSDCVRCAIVSHEKAINLLESMLSYAYKCVHSVFSVDAYGAETSENIAHKCLEGIKTQSKGLFVNMEQIKADITRLKNKSNLYHCCM